MVSREHKLKGKFSLFGFSCFAYVEFEIVLLVWSNPNQPNRRSAERTVILPLWWVFSDAGIEQSRKYCSWKINYEKMLHHFTYLFLSLIVFPLFWHTFYHLNIVLFTSFPSFLTLVNIAQWEWIRSKCLLLESFCSHPFASSSQYSMGPLKRKLLSSNRQMYK